MQFMVFPGEENWKWSNAPNPYLELDVAHARRRYFGKTIEQVLPYFRDNASIAADDLRCLPAIPFRYYIFAFTQYLLTEANFSGTLSESFNAAEDARSFLSLVESMLSELPEFILPIMGELMPAIDFAGTNQNIQNSDPEIYERCSELRRKILGLYEKATP